MIHHHPPVTSDCLIPEWAPQDAVLLAWPHPDSDWHSLLPAVEDDFKQLALAIAGYQSVIVLVQDSKHRDHVSTLLSNTPTAFNIYYCDVPTDDTWCRDFGPLTVSRGGEPVLLNFRFNAWGERYPWRRDDAVTARLSEQQVFKAPVLQKDFVLEGGGIESDGAGTLLTTEQCLLHGNRNPGRLNATRRDCDAELGGHLPFERILWLREGYLAGDDTDGHIDNLARFADSGTIVYSTCERDDGEHFVALSAMRLELEAMRRTDGQAYRLIPLPLPAPVYSQSDKNRRLPASYANFLIINNAVLVPQFNDPLDTTARERLQSCFPDRAMVGVESRRFIEQNGGIHCLTLQLPAGTVNFERFIS